MNKPAPIFGELDYRMSVVKRWSVVSTLRQQSLAEHSFNVALMADRIATNWFGIQDKWVRFEVYDYAIKHDRKEAITGDFPSYIKRFVDELAIDEHYAEEFGIELEAGKTIRHIVKIADYMDAIIYLDMEMAHGNKSVLALRTDLRNRFETWCDANGHKSVPALADLTFNNLGAGSYTHEIVGFK